MAADLQALDGFECGRRKGFWRRGGNSDRYKQCCAQDRRRVGSVGQRKTVIRAGYGFFYDHPALALAFLATAEDGATSALLETGPGAPCSGASCFADLNPFALNATNIFQGLLTSTGGALTGCTPMPPALPFVMCYQPDQQRFNPFQANSIFTNQNFLTAGFPLTLLPFTIPVTKNFQYALAQQANLTIEREITKDWKISVGYKESTDVYRKLAL
jgi:hypothetical protein